MASNDEVRRLSERVNRAVPAGFARVETAYLELAQPGIADGLATCMAAGASEIVVFTYFLAGGTHVAADIPLAIAAFRATHPQIKVSLTRHLGESDLLPQAIWQIASAT